ncbi:prepilin-type N-terminal cleavage/methylation domain-containing protein [Methylotenera sp.]|uniref:prepilin-type N-terminal cleavage/methylation domain-containing protein n=1 Tax=Methylotenera sp. TaxID=2051956 RepID=UPI002487E431|nr:prepilin-type N-terminal cleavage/methylation domain-containing protein [Methylotenera sp.]MDI1298377.1 prepilin-type N-terminal cleavage/methylation domain-containing protein [Methylotenera sp.]
MMNPRQHQCGMTLIELVIAMAISAIIMLALNNLVKLGLDVQTAGRGTNELAYQGRFALERMADKARSLAPKVLTTPTANTTGDWFAPSACTGATCVMYCRNASNQLIETVTTDNSCTGTTVIANNVTTFSATLPASMGAVDKSVAAISLTLSDANKNTVSLSTSMRLGGGSL